MFNKVVKGDERVRRSGRVGKRGRGKQRVEEVIYRKEGE